jgi:hypothetical protein
VKCAENACCDDGGEDLASRKRGGGRSGCIQEVEDSKSKKSLQKELLDQSPAKVSEGADPGPENEIAPE